MKRAKKLAAVALSAALCASVFAGCSQAEQEAESVASEVESVAESQLSEAESVVEDVVSDVEGAAETVVEDVEDEFETLEGDAETIISAAKDKIDTWVTDAETQVQGMGEAAEADVQEAVDYIEAHIAEPFESGEVTKKLTQYALELKNMGENTAELAEHDITKLGQNVYSFMTKVVKEGEDVASEAATTLKTDIQSGLEAIKNGGETVISDFCSLFNQNKAS